MAGIRITDWQNFASGLLFAAFGALTAIIAVNYPMGTATQMGAGYLPLLLGLILLLLGLLISLRSVELASDRRSAVTREHGAFAADGAGTRRNLRALFFVTTSLIFFGLVLPDLGLIFSVMGVVVISSFAEPGLRWIPTTLLAVVMASLATAIFKFGIGLPFQLWP